MIVMAVHTMLVQYSSTACVEFVIVLLRTVYAGLHWLHSLPSDSACVLHLYYIIVCMSYYISLHQTVGQLSRSGR